MKYAVFQSGGKQHVTKEGETIEIDRIIGKKGDKIKIEDVLFIRDGEKYIVGNPLIKSAFIDFAVIDETKGDKVTVAKFKAKVRYRKKIGFRAKYTKLLTEKIHYKE